MAAPIASREAAALVETEADMVVILGMPEYLVAIGEWYGEFAQVSDAEVCALLADHRARSRERRAQGS